MNQATVSFRTMQNGAYEYIKPGQRRGYWRVLVGPVGMHARSNARGLISESVTDSGIDGVTPRSGYYLGREHACCKQVSDTYNQLIAYCDHSTAWRMSRLAHNAH